MLWRCVHQSVCQYVSPSARPSIVFYSFPDNYSLQPFELELSISKTMEWAGTYTVLRLRSNDFSGVTPLYLRLFSMIVF